MGMLYRVVFDHLLGLHGHEEGGTATLRNFLTALQSTRYKIPKGT
jgi:hypothetical protein